MIVQRLSASCETMYHFDLSSDTIINACSKIIIIQRETETINRVIRTFDRVNEIHFVRIALHYRRWFPFTARLLRKRDSIDDSIERHVGLHARVSIIRVLARSILNASDGKSF